MEQAGENFELEEIEEHISETRLALAAQLLADGAYEDARVAFSSALQSPSKEHRTQAHRGVCAVQRQVGAHDLASFGVTHSSALEVRQLLRTTIGGVDVAGNPAASVAGTLGHGAGGTPPNLEAGPGVDQFAVTFLEKGSVGLSFEATGDCEPVRIAVVAVDSPASRVPQLQSGLILTAVAGVKVEGRPFASVLSLLTAQRPLTLSFRRDRTHPLGARVERQAAKPTARDERYSVDIDPR